MTILSPSQHQVLRELHDRNPEADVTEVKRLMENRFKSGGKGQLLWESLEWCVRQFYPLAVDSGLSVLYYRDGVWNRNGETELSRLVIALLGEAGVQPNATKVLDRIRVSSQIIEGVGPNRYMNFQNGMLDLDSLELLPHSPEFGSTVQLLVDWNPDAQAPAFESWLRETVDADLHEVILQVMGAALYPGAPFQVAVALIGPGGNGKGTLERTIRRMLPGRAVSSIDIADLSSNRFAAADLYGATTNLCGDIRPFTINDTAMFKKLTGDDVVRAERKFGQPFDFKSEAFLMFSGNAMPPSTDPSEGWARRWLIVPMERAISGPLNSSIEAQIQTRGELEGIARFAVEAVLRAKQAGRFSEPEACRLAKAEYRRECSTIHAFVADALQIDHEGAEIPTFTSRANLSSAYAEYCAVNRCARASNRTLYSTLLRIGEGKINGGSRSSSDAQEGGRGFSGVSIRPGWGGAPRPV